MLLAESSNQIAKETTAKKQRFQSVTASNKVQNSANGSFDALLKLAQYPIKARAKVNRDLYIGKNQKLFQNQN